jgi:hypothetical protein
LFCPAVSLVESALSLLLKTDGDLAGWLGDLAPRGDLDSTQLLYRIFGVSMSNVNLACRGPSAHDKAISQAAMCLTSQGLPMLSLAFRMLNPAASAAVRASRGAVDGTVQGSTSSTGTGSCKNRIGAGSNGADSTSVSQQSSSGSGSSKHQQPGNSGSSGTGSGGRGGPSLVEALAQSPVSV